jgi:hypothetical protein
MDNERNRLIFPLACCAIVSVATFSGIGIAAITGQLAVSSDKSVLYTSDDELSKRIKAGEKATAEIPRPTHVGLTRSAMNNGGDGDLPKILRVSQRFSQTLKPTCSRCGVIDSIEPHALQMPDPQGPANVGGSGAFGASMFTGGNRSVYAADPGNGDVATSFIVRLRMEDGSLRTIYENQRPKFSVGEKVQLINGSLVSMG